MESLFISENGGRKNAEESSEKMVRFRSHENFIFVVLKALR